MDEIYCVVPPRSPMRIPDIDGATIDAEEWVSRFGVRQYSEAIFFFADHKDLGET